MWVPKNSTWHNDSTKLERFFIEKIIQRCDYDETISKKHRTINGFTQLQELIRLAELSKKRIRTLRTLIVLLKEAKSKYIKQNIVNDIIIIKYFADLKDYILNFNEDDSFKNDSLDKIDNFIHNLKKFSIQLEKYYFKYIVQELKEVDFKEKVKIERITDLISKLVDIIIPYLLHKGYSISTLNEVLRSWIQSREYISLEKFLDFFSHSEHFYELIVFIGNNTVDNEDIKNIIYSKGFGNIRKAIDFTYDFEKPKSSGHRDEVICYETRTIDPVSLIRNQYDDLLKSTVISKDRKSLNIFTNFFKNSYWRKTGSSHKFFKNIIISGDPISVTSRRGTVFLSLIDNKSILFNENSSLDFIKNDQLKKALYYYNLALGSKSIENSLSLLWTSIESILPYRSYKADIENVRDIFGKIFSYGSFTRDIQYLIKRIFTVNTVNQGCFNTIGVNSLPKYNRGTDMYTWIEWLKNDSQNKFKQFNDISSLLANEYLYTMKPILEGKLESILERINSSKESIEFQLQRIYLHRNQIVHSGDYINEYTNLWIHLEWYIGKFLYYIIFKTEINSEYSDIEELFRNLESDFEYCYSYLEKNPNKLCRDSDRIFKLLLEIDWQ
ncbi:hypothetical protein [Chryseobacterium hagamense]|uniref:Apea-like HEPN domain-containing protein n=1 Tax=Chryseobacterium hagamense TaxID=395935 RepID=A0A511YNZ1_9FLAO|nr:hypothetical protein [Chryseobacterium hagamense]GEN76915.1 hypothetical protein CHA01nite_26550 [Chryseobacterium hagamense]